MPGGPAQPGRSPDLGPPISYKVLEPGTPVLSNDGQEVGKVAHVQATDKEDVFDGIVIETRLGPVRKRLVDAFDIGEI